MTLAANYLELAERHSDCVNRPLASGGNTSGNVKRVDRHWAAIGSVIFLHDWDVAAARWWDEGGSSLSCDGRASTRFVVQNTAMSNHRESPAGSTGTIFAAISMFASACVGETCVAVGRYASGVVAYEWGAYWVNLGSARFRLESLRWFSGSSLNRQGRRQVRQPHCPVCVFRFLGQSTPRFSGSARR
jgi:hypothetical protein